MKKNNVAGIVSITNTKAILFVYKKKFLSSPLAPSSYSATFTFMAYSLYVTAYDEALQMVRQNVKSSEILTYLATAAEKASGQDSVVSIMLIDAKGLLRNGASPKLPDDYLMAIDGLKPDPNVGTCAAAAATGEIVFTPSFYADNKWSELRHLPTSLGFVGAWSYPIKNDGEKVVGTFGTYFRQQRKPSDEEIKGTALLATVAAMALTKDVSVSL